MPARSAVCRPPATCRRLAASKRRPAALEAWLRGQRARLSNSSAVAGPIDYMLRGWDRFARFIDDAFISIVIV